MAERCVLVNDSLAVTGGAWRGILVIYTCDVVLTYGWSADWQDERPPAPSYLRILYLGKILQDEDTLISAYLHAPRRAAPVRRLTGGQRLDSQPIYPRLQAKRTVRQPHHSLPLCTSLSDPARHQGRRTRRRKGVSEGTRVQTIWNKHKDWVAAQVALYARDAYHP